jgi:hypothetical protein
MTAAPAENLFVSPFDGATATMFCFLGIPALGAAMGLYVLQRWRAGAFHSTGHSRPSSS